MTTPAITGSEVRLRDRAFAWRVLIARVPVPLAQALLIATALYVVLHGWRRSLAVPFAFSIDSVWFLTQSKSTVDNGWWWWNPRLGAPFGLDAVAIPSNSTVDQAIVWLVSRFVGEAITAVNVAWLVMVVLSGLTATWCMRKLGVSTFVGVVVGTLFALSPYALYRNIDHFALVIYLVPFVCAAALRLAAGDPHQLWDRTERRVIVAGCVLLGLNYVYYAFFGVFCVAAGTVIGYIAARDRRILASGTLCMMLICASTLLNLAPSFSSWQRHGYPTILRDKVVAESEAYGLKIRHLVSPVFPNRVRPLEAWVERETAARFPNENENWTSRLGLVGALGFIGLLVLLFVPDTGSGRAGSALRGASRLMLALLLLGVVGGFGSLFNLFVSADIRAYNRVAPFIAFLSLLAVAAVSDRWLKSTRARSIAGLMIVVAGVTDQGQAAARMNDEYPAVAAELSALRAFVGHLERELPANAMVFQLPIRIYTLGESDKRRMKQFDHFKPYLVAESLRFSYPALSDEQVRWQHAAGRLELRALIARLSTQGFAAVLVDRHGYDDNATAMTSALLRVVGDDRVIAESDRFFAVNIAGIPEPLTARGELLEAVAVTLSLTPCVTQQPYAAVVKVEDQVNQIGMTFAPFDAAGAQVPSSEAFKVAGWAVDPPKRSPAGGVDVVIDRLVFPSIYGTARDDVAEYFRREGYRDTGFTATIPANTIAAGEHWLSVRVVSTDGACYYQSPPLRLTAR
jgi:phosphoglycerol transferase